MHRAKTLVTFTEFFIGILPIGTRSLTMRERGQKGWRKILGRDSI
jgi:hypothetical protein